MGERIKDLPLAVHLRSIPSFMRIFYYGFLRCFMQLARDRLLLQKLFQRITLSFYIPSITAFTIELRTLSKCCSLSHSLLWTLKEHLMSERITTKVHSAWNTNFNIIKMLSAAYVAWLRLDRWLVEISFFAFHSNEQHFFPGHGLDLIFARRIS